jgi:chromosome segregation ATPase
VQENDDYFTQNLKLEVGLDAVRDRMEVFKGRWEDAEVDMLELKERQQNAESSLAEARLEVKELHVQLENLRRRCQNCERELRMAKKKETRQEDDPVRQKQLVEVISQKDALQVQRRKAAEKQKAHQEESRKIQEVPKEKKAAVTNLRVTTKTGTLCE